MSKNEFINETFKNKQNGWLFVIMSLGIVFGKGLEEKHDKRTSKQLAMRLGEFLEIKKEHEKIVEAINNTLTKLSKKDKEFADLVIKDLITLYPDIHQKYNFKLNP